MFHASSANMVRLMKALFLFLGLALSAFVFSASAQINVDLSLSQEQFLPGEPIRVSVHVTNHSGQALHLGDDQSWLSFFVQPDDGGVVARKSEPPVVGAFDLGSEEVATKKVNLAPYFTLTHTGRYKVSATVHIKAWNTDITSAPQEFDLIQGAELWSQVFGVPNSSTPNSPPVARKYSLIEANYLRSQLRLYVQVTSQSDGNVVKVMPVGPMISFGQPEAQLDPSSNLHILYQDGASTFKYAVVTPDGNLMEQAKYDYVSTRPRLQQDSNGNITVYGGVPRVDPPDAVKSPDQLPQ
jgi:hypothetical protein